MTGDESMHVDGEENFGTCLSSLIDNGSIESHIYYSARKTALEMLNDRGFAVPSREIEVSLEKFRNKHGVTPDAGELRISALHKDNPSVKIGGDSNEYTDEDFDDIREELTIYVSNFIFR